MNDAQKTRRENGSGQSGAAAVVQRDSEDEAISEGSSRFRPRPVWFAIYAGALTVAFGTRLAALVPHALKHDLHSHIILIPFVTAYLIFQRRGELPKRSQPMWPGVLGFALGGLGFLAVAWTASSVSPNDSLALMVAAYLAMLVAGAFGFVGRAWMRALAFPVFFLVFMIPLPDGAVVWIEQSLQVASAEAADVLFGFSGTSAYREGLVFNLPGISIRVAQECSGIRSTWVLLITSLLASHMFLSSPWRRAVLVMAIIPLGIIRNGFRVVTIGLLCVYKGPHMIDSDIHRQGGPVFFALSLIPLFLLLWWLRRGERHQGELGEESREMDRAGKVKS